MEYWNLTASTTGESVSTALLNMGDEQLAYWIPQFFVEVHKKKRKKDVSPEKYPPKTVYAIVYTKMVWMSSRLRSTLVTKVLLVELGATRGQLQDNEKKCQI